MNDDQITGIIVAMLTNKYIIPENDNEKTAKEIAKIFKILKEKTNPDKNRDDQDVEERP